MNPAQQEVAIKRALRGDWQLADRLEIEALIEARRQPWDRNDPFPDIDHDPDELRWWPISIVRQFGPLCRTAISWASCRRRCECVGIGPNWQARCQRCRGSGYVAFGERVMTDTDCRILLDEELPPRCMS